MHLPNLFFICSKMWSLNLFINLVLNPLNTDKAISTKSFKSVLFRKMIIWKLFICFFEGNTPVETRLDRQLYRYNRLSLSLYWTKNNRTKYSTYTWVSRFLLWYVRLIEVKMRTNEMGIWKKSYFEFLGYKLSRVQGSQICPNILLPI